MVKDILLTWLEENRTRVVEEIEKEQKNVLVGKVLDGINKVHRKYVRHGKYSNMEKNNRTLQEFIRGIKFEYKEEGKIINKIKDSIVVDQEKKIIYYEKKLEEKDREYILEKFMVEIANAFIFSRNSVITGYYMRGFSSESKDHEDISKGYDKRAVAEQADKIYVILLRAVGCAKYLDGESDRIVERYIELYNYFNDEKDNKIEINLDKMLYYYKNIRKSKNKSKLKLLGYDQEFI